VRAVALKLDLSKKSTFESFAQESEKQFKVSLDQIGRDQM
jgi:hypothetical protein